MIVRRGVLQAVAGLVIGFSGLGFSSLPVQAQEATQLSLAYSSKRFQPVELNAPADRPIVLRVKNADAKAMEFESKSLRVEKIIAANSEGVFNIRALKPGRYEFFDEFNPDSRGAIVVK